MIHFSCSGAVSKQNKLLSFKMELFFFLCASVHEIKAGPGLVSRLHRLKGENKISALLSFFLYIHVMFNWRATLRLGLVS